MSSSATRSESDPGCGSLPADPVGRDRTRLDSSRGSERESRAARDRALGRGGARRVPAVHVHRRRREPVRRAQSTGWPRGDRPARRCRRGTGLRRRVRRGSSVRAERHRCQDVDSRSRPRTRDRFPTCSRSDVTSSSTASFAAGSSSRSRVDDHEVPVEVRAEEERRLRLGARPCPSSFFPGGSAVLASRRLAYGSLRSPGPADFFF